MVWWSPLFSMYTDQDQGAGKGHDGDQARGGGELSGDAYRGEDVIKRLSAALIRVCMWSVFNKCGQIIPPDFGRSAIAVHDFALFRYFE